MHASTYEHIWLYLYLLGESYQDGYLSTPYQDAARFICSRDFDSNIFVDTRYARLQQGVVTSIELVHAPGAGVTVICVSPGIVFPHTYP